MVLNQPPLLLVVECKFLVLFAILRPTVRKMCHFLSLSKHFIQRPRLYTKRTINPRLINHPLKSVLRKRPSHLIIARFIISGRVTLRNRFLCFEASAPDSSPLSYENPKVCYSAHQTPLLVANPNYFCIIHPVSLSFVM